MCQGLGKVVHLTRRSPWVSPHSTKHMKKHLATLLAAAAVATSAHAVPVNFTYSQTNSTTGSGSIAPFTFSGHDFTLTAMPPATVFNPNPASTPAGFVGAQTVATGNSNEANVAVGLLFSGTVTATSSDGFLIDIPLLFAPKQTQAPDVNDYNWTVTYGDSVSGGIDGVSSGALRFAFYFGRDDVVDGAETANTFQRYTQQNITFVVGQDSFSNTDISSGAIKDATDAGAPAGTDAAGRNLDFYYGWRDTGSLTSGAILIDDFNVGGILIADDASLRPVPEPSSALLVCAASSLLFLRRRRS